MEVLVVEDLVPCEAHRCSAQHILKQQMKVLEMVRSGKFAYLSQQRAYLHQHLEGVRAFGQVTITKREEAPAAAPNWGGDPERLREQSLMHLHENHGQLA
ncbi:hypothetical protein ASC67_11130 [Methylibium sp. Root1272]|nr:hypothetical protein ASC67_11130 [Methylibium sp. Root1272]